jgi:YYY domain-containing protein
MLPFFLWYLFITLIGWLAFPLAYRLFPALADRGFLLTRPLGLLVWGYVFWMMASLGIIQNDGGGLLLALVVLVAVSGASLLKKEARAALRKWIGSHVRMIVMVEVLFFLAFAAWAFVRASNPNIEVSGGEKVMELAFINAILRSPTFPPHDPWLSGYAISYYYFGYVMTAMLAKATGTLGSVAHNLMSALIFAMSFLGAYGILYNLLAVWRNRHPVAQPVETAQAGKEQDRPSLGLPLLGPLFLLFVSNLEGFLEVLHQMGLFWKLNPDGTGTSAFWAWLGIKNLVDPPVPPLGVVPNRFIWWWQASRVIQDYDLAHNFREIIDEFPAFSYLLGDLHPHVLAMPFDLLMVAVALNLFLGGWKGDTNLRFYRLSINLPGLLFGGLLLGGLAFLNTWDILLGFALLAGAYVLSRVLESGWTWGRLKDLFAISVPMGLLAVVLYLPFYVGFQSQAGGILPNLDSPTRGAQLWVMFGPLFLALLAYLVYLWRSEKRPADWKWGFGLAVGLVVFLWLVSWALAFMALWLNPGVVKGLIDSECSGSIALCFTLTGLRRLSYIGGLLTLLGLLGVALSLLVKAGDRKSETEKPRESLVGHPLPFVLLLITLGAVLAIAPEFVFLRDLFVNRMNTIFKFYYQAWLLWSLVSAFGVAVLLHRLRGAWSWVFRAGLGIILFMALAYPVLGLPDKTNDFQLPAFEQKLKAAQAAKAPAALQTAARVWTLDGAQAFQTQYPDDAAAARWLLNAPEGVLVEAFNKSSSYTDYARMSTYSGDPTVLGWWYHEWQWRGSVDEQVSPITNLTCKASDPYDPRRMRSDDISCLYETNSWDVASEIIAQYNIRYVVVGTLERRDYHIDEALFQQHLLPVFQQGQVVIYEVP